MARGPVIFDCDGVLVDSEDLSWEAWRRVSELHDVVVTDDDIRAFTGRRAVDIAGELAGRSSSADPVSLAAGVEAMTITLFEERLESFEDAEDTAEHLRRIGFQLAVASSSSRPRLVAALRVTRLDRLFPAVVSGDDIEHGKPAPDIYEAAAAALGAEPGDCVAVEDTAPGIASAAAAGMRVVAVDRGMFPAETLRAADVVVPRLTPAVFLG